MRAAIAIVLVAACSSGAKPPQPQPPAPVVPVVVAPKPPDPYAALDLDFEAVESGHPKGWMSPQDKSQWGAATDQVHGGTYSLRIAPEIDKFVAAAASSDAKPFAGKHVRLRGWIRTQDAQGGCALWIRADAAGNSVLDNMGASAPSGTTPWTAASAEIDVPADAQAIFFGAFVQGHGTAWFDDLTIEVTTPEPAKPIVLTGIVVGPDGKPVPGAEVGLVGAQAIERHVTADANGAWKLDTKSGKWGVSAATPTATGFIDSATYDKDTGNIKLAIAGGVKVRGKLAIKPVADTFVTVSVISQHDSDLFVVRVADDGTFATQVPRSPSVTVQMLDHAIGQASKEITGDAVDIEVPAAVLAPPDQAVVDWTATHAFPIATVEAGHGFDDLAPFAKLIGNAHVIALGEATHGTREFFQMKHRMLEYLVAKLGVTTFAIEANQPECRAIDDYVVNGKGDAKTALAGIYFWTWNTEEVLAMIEWMRAYNADPKHATKIHFTGFDMQTSHVAHANVVAYLKDAGADDALAAPLAPLGDKMSAESIGKLDAAAQGKIAAGLAAVAKAFDANKTAWKKQHTATAFEDARHDVTVLQQALAMYTAKDNASFDVRDQSMADNIDWLRKQGPASLRIMVWAHNGHIANKLAAFKNMGSILHKRYARDYVNIGFVFGDGGFQAIDNSKSAPGAMGTLGPITVGPPATTNGTAPFDETGKPLLALDLHAVPAKGPVHDWFGAQHPYRDIGAVYFSEATMLVPMALTELYDAVIYVAHTTHAQPITGFKRRGT